METETTPDGQRQRIVVVSNRLPVVVKPDERGGFRVNRGSGGLVQALEPLLERSSGTWIGWPGVVAEELTDAMVGGAERAADGYRLVPVPLSRADVDQYYAGFSNSVIWPLFHGLANHCDFRPEYWDAYLRVNERFASRVADALGDGDDLVWIHDYHLIQVAEALRERRSPSRLGFFLHTPFPSLDDFVKLPWRAQLLRGLIAYDLLGFQSPRDLRNFVSCLEHLAPGAEVVRADMAGAEIFAGGRRILAGVFPIGTSFDEFSSRAASNAVEHEIRRLRTGVGPFDIVLGVDRLDYTKGLVERLRAFERALERHPELFERVVLLQLVVPSRENVRDYAELKQEIDRIVGRIVGKYATPRWEPIRYLYTSVPKESLVALYRAASAALVTPLADGMNLVAKEFCASQIDESGVLILSEMAGAASQLVGGALLVNPYDEDGTADAVWEAFRMPRAERAARMRLLRDIVQRTDVFWWGEQFLQSLVALEPPRWTAEEYLPTIEVGRDGGAAREGRA